MKPQVILLLFLIFGCNNENRPNKQIKYQELVNKPKKSVEVAQVACKTTTKADSVKETPIVHIKREMLLGAWTDGSSSNASFGIYQDSIFYVDALDTYHYKILVDSLFIDFSDWMSNVKVTKLTKDSMMWESDMGQSTFWRFNNVEILSPSLSKLNDSVSTFLTKRTLLNQLGNPSRIVDSDIECGVTEEQEYAKEQKFYYYDSTKFFIFDEKAELMIVNFNSGKFSYQTPEIHLSNKTTFADLEKVYPISCSNARMQNSGEMVRIRPCEECDGEVHLFFKGTKLERLEFWVPC